MSSEFDIKIQGFEEIQQALCALPVQMQAKILRNVISQAAQQNVIKPLRENLNYSTAEEKNIKLTYDSNNKLMVTAGVSRAGYKLNWADRGTKVRQTKKGANRGKIEGKKQIQPALVNSVEPTVKYVENETASEIDKILKRYLKKYTK